MPELINGVLEIRSLDERTKGVMGDHQQPVTAISGLIIVRFKTTSVRDFILSKKCDKGNLTINKVFSINKQGNIFVRKFLPTASYVLLRRINV